MKKICDYIANDSKNNSKKVFNDIIRKIDHLNNFQSLGKVVLYEGISVRELLIYSYRIFYKINNNDIVIIAIVHQSKRL
ncbi:type II toxin-antitoxin system RelE/ParE family toxin [Candidatus Parcubacteria bacterium]|nr:type II toxin-antitoxin system RelE/ParE family toxin [Candidatus Parcubacteria bacterium]